MVDTETQKIVYHGETFDINRGKEFDKHIIDKKTNTSRLVKASDTTGFIKFSDGTYAKIPVFPDALRKRVGKTLRPPKNNLQDVTYGEVLEALQKTKEGEARIYGNVPNYYRSSLDNKKMIERAKMIQFTKLLKGLEREIDLIKGRQIGETTKSPKGELVAPTEFDLSYEQFLKDPIIAEWISGFGRKGLPDKQERETSPRNLWKFLIIADIGTAEQLQGMSKEELIGKNQISGILKPYPDQWRVNAIIKKVTENNYSLFEQQVIPKSKSKDLPVEVYTEIIKDKTGEKEGNTKIRWIDKPIEIKFKSKALDVEGKKTQIVISPDEFIDLVNENILGTMGQTSWYPIAKAIRGFVNAGFGRLPASSPLAQSVEDWAGNYADIHLTGTLESGQLHEFAECLRKKNHDAYFFFLLALEMGFRKTEAFTLNAMPPEERQKKDKRIAGTSGVTAMPQDVFPDMYEITIITWKTHWIGVYSHKEICANPAVNKLIKERLEQIAQGKGIDPNSPVHALVGEDNYYYPVRTLETKNPLQTAQQVRNMKQLYDDIKECFREVGATRQYFQDHAFHAFRHIFAQFQLEASDWDYASVADMGHWTTLNVLKDSYGKKKDTTRYMEKISRMQKGMANPIKVASEQLANSATEKQKAWINEQGLKDELMEFQKMQYVRSHDKRFLELINDGTIDIKEMPAPQQNFYEKLKEGEVGDVQDIPEDNLVNE